MPLVNYSSSEDEAVNQNKATSLKRKRPAAYSGELPPLPASFHDLYATNARVATTDDPNLHGGRKRHIPHIEGNWPTHVYLEWRPSSAELKILTELVSATGNGSDQIHSLLQSDLSTPLPLHISLSRSLVLHTHQREQFQDVIATKIRSSAVRPFKIDFNSLAWYPNHDNTRWFLSLSAARPKQNELNRLLDACNRSAKQLQQPTLYLPENIEDSAGQAKVTKKAQAEATLKDEANINSNIPDCSDSFHVSLAWSLSQPSEYVVSDLRKLTFEQLSAFFDGVKVKIGNTVSTVTVST
ncbi:hypothetical protein EJ08DRAFT_625344 [Tothia fuscella]|uniref:U6 snRNA phosphodiesterase n=1 Tax=Tothia fuscella TaxID=1048955 RepID=A0A9P4P1X5_9PEZI|nr:hypothetical protein EJ08DRAFT_625344 [Tothia fuscella]